MKKAQERNPWRRLTALTRSIMDQLKMAQREAYDTSTELMHRKWAWDADGVKKSGVFLT